MTFRLPPFSRRNWLGLLSVAGLAALTGCSASGALNALVPSDSYRLRADLAYGPAARQRLDVYLPLERRTPGPVVVFFYGGSWTTGERATYRFVGEALASRGIAVVVADYRLSPAVRYPVFLQDSAQALRWTMDHLGELGADPRQVFVMGHSAGAYNAAMLALDARWLAGAGLQPAQLAGWIGLAGPYDFLPIGNRDVQWPSTGRAHRPTRSPWSTLREVRRRPCCWPRAATAPSTRCATPKHWRAVCRPPACQWGCRSMTGSAT